MRAETGCRFPPAHFMRGFRNADVQTGIATHAGEQPVDGQRLHQTCGAGVKRAAARTAQATLPASARYTGEMRGPRTALRPTSSYCRGPVSAGPASSGRLIRLLTNHTGLCFTSSKSRPTYSPRMPRHTSWTAEKNNSTKMSDVQPRA